MRLGEKITVTRKRLGLSQKELAEAIEKPEPRISEWVNRKKGAEPDLATALRLARALGVPLEFLIDDEMVAVPKGLSPDEERVLAFYRLVRDSAPGETAEAWRRLTAGGIDPNHVLSVPAHAPGSEQKGAG